MNKLHLVFCFVALILTVSVNAQQDPQVSHNMFNHLSVNPGFAGSNQAICANAIHRQQYMGFEGYPVTTLFNVDMPIKSISSGIGLSIMNDKAGNEKNVGVKLAYAYNMDMGDGKLGIGLNIGMLNKSLDGKWITPSDLSGEGGADPSIPQANASHMAFDMALGVFYRTNDLYVGLSSTHLNQPKMDFDLSNASVLRRHYYITAGYFYKLPGNPLFEVRPSIFVKSDGATSQIDLNASVLYNKMIWGGVSYRTSDAILAMLGIELKNGIKVGYAFDIVTSKIGSYNRLSHEVILGYCFNVSVDKRRGGYKSVRFL
jgi:type IX secretion system PorP/SprF family membrane protein